MSAEPLSPHEERIFRLIGASSGCVTALGVSKILHRDERELSLNHPSTVSAVQALESRCWVIASPKGVLHLTARGEDVYQRITAKC